MPTDTVCGPVHGQFGLEDMGASTPNPQIETWARLLGMEKWSQEDFEWISGSAQLFLDQAKSAALTHHCPKLSCVKQGKMLELPVTGRPKTRKGRRIITPDLRSQKLG